MSFNTLIPPIDDTPPNTSITSGPSGWITTDSATFKWTGSDNETATGDLVYSYKLDSGSWPSWTGSTSKTYNNLSEGSHTFKVKAKDEAGNEDESPASRSFSVDTADPDAPSIHPGCNASDNQWQNTCRDPDFSWRATDPNGSDGSGIDQYAYAWNTSASDNPTTWGDAASHDPGPIADADGVARRYLHVKAKDVAGNTSSVNTFGLWYDGSAPTASAIINEGASTTNQTTVRLSLTTADTGSGVTQVRLSHNGLYWDDWQPIADEITWALPALDRRELPVYAQVRDGAGNLSSVVSDTIALDLYPPAPHSANYRICNHVIDTGGSVGITSTSYFLISAIGQPWATGADANASTGFAERGGFLANLDGCRPISHTVTDNFDIPRWVIASGGNLRSSASYQLGDTAGEPAASGANAFTSANYTLSSGFWGDVTASECPAPLTEVSITGPITGAIDTDLTFEATITPDDATEPLTTTWSPTPDNGQGTMQATYQWDAAGEQTISVEVENCGGSVSDAHTVDIQEPTDVCTTSLSGVDVTGPVSGVVDTLLTFEASVTPDDATLPITYDWTPAPESGQGTTQAAYRWAEAGEKTITVTAENCGAALSASRIISVLLAPPSGFGVSLNDGALYTNDPQVTVRTWAPDGIAEMRLSNDGGYTNDGWQAYQVTTTWEIETYGDYVIPRTVYVWFKDAQNQVYGAHTDDIIYDPVPPTGTLSIQSRDGNQVTLSLDATDDNSGVAEMRVGGSEDLSGAAWEPFAARTTVTLAGDVAYAQFRDHAGNASSVYGSDGSTSEHQIYLPLVLRK